MDTVGVGVSAAIGVIASAATAYLTVRINAKQERKKFERELASKMAELRNPPDEHTRILAMQFAEGFLLVERGLDSDREKVFLPSGCRITLGRDQYNHIVVDSPHISRTHVSFSALLSEVFFEPLAPTHPASINGVVKSSRTRLKKGDVITFDGVNNLRITFHTLAN